MQNTLMKFVLSDLKVDYYKVLIVEFEININRLLHIWHKYFMYRSIS